MSTMVLWGGQVSGGKCLGMGKCPALVGGYETTMVVRGPRLRVCSP